VDGRLVCPATDDGGWVAEAVAGGVPLVLLDRTVREARVPVVRADGRAALRELAAHLVGLGHRRIGVIAGPERISSGRERLAAFLAALAEFGVPPRPTHVAHGDFRRESGATAARRLMTLDDRPSVLVAMDNLMGLGALAELRRGGWVVPDGVGLAVYDDQPWFPLLDPPITVIAQPTVEMGRAAARSLLALVAGERVDDVLLPARLVTRRSCGEGRATNRTRTC
jgi:LacI family transcriptional regulator